MTFQTIRIPHLLAFSLSFAPGAACSLQKADLGAYSGTESTDTSSGSAAETSTSGDVITGESPRQTTSTEALTSHGAETFTSTGTPWPGCIGPEEGTAVAVEVSAPTLIDPEAYPIEFDVRCSVQGIAGGAIALQCTDDAEGIHAVTLTLTTEAPHTGLLGGETDVRLRYRETDSQEFGLDIRTHVALHAVDDGALLLFYTLGYHVFAEDFEAFWAPMHFVDGDLGFCPAQPDEQCGTTERTTVYVHDGVDQVTVYDGNLETFPASSMYVYAESARDTVQTNVEDCHDVVYGRWVELLALKADL
ncbi:hypothetical protein SAMN02745121_00777 [Nannocystis exedens]|uniref:Uncharacterized protein n=1 Tax=Nannocystis exedens TaxID=54 RepID=A0A1I1TRW0_9BACT|nr:hypothetical protein [Nannocystis exedens]PCC66494.1 hypothetical protein NAEX_09082 [Nannocystis exedens]SFD59193.1 hypothetical protein SAMN02745121_00777 [Nannocystis exedens]